MTPRDLHRYLVSLAVEAGADPERASERMAQAAQVLAIEHDLSAESHALDCCCAGCEAEVLAALPCACCGEVGEHEARCAFVEGDEPSTGDEGQAALHSRAWLGERGVI